MTGHIVLFFWLAEADSRLYAEFELFQLVRECIQFDCRYTAGYACTVV